MGCSSKHLNFNYYPYLSYKELENTQIRVVEKHCGHI